MDGFRLAALKHVIVLMGNVDILTLTSKRLKNYTLSYGINHHLTIWSKGEIFNEIISLTESSTLGIYHQLEICNITVRIQHQKNKIKQKISMRKRFRCEMYKNNVKCYRDGKIRIKSEPMTIHRNISERSNYLVYFHHLLENADTRFYMCLS